MIFLNNYKDIVGKKILYFDIPRYADEMIIVTEDKEILVFDRDLNEEIEVYNTGCAKMAVLKNKRVRDELLELGVLTKEELEAYVKEEKEKAERQRIERERKNKEFRYKQYLELKKEFENKE